jgi:tetratricopeptide (TPR) repeat protein/2-polyprenyl-3-methyl-5-hydroxy-6-metoxy-1,4-benzoquinol methylase
MNRKERRTAQRLGRSADVTAADQAQRLFAQALQYHQLGQLPEAERYYRSMLAVKPKHEHSLYNLGLLALQTGRNELGADMLGKAVAINGRDPEWRYNYAFSLQQSGRLDEAAEQYGRAVALKPDYVEAHLNLGNLLLRLGRLAEATVSYQKVAALKPDFAETHYNLGNVFAMQGKIDEAVACFERSIAIKPLAEAHNNLGIALANDPARAEQAMAHYRQALAINPQFVEAENNIANLHAARGEYEKAAELLDKIVKAHPDHPNAHENLARVLIAAGKAVAAIPILTQALKLREVPSVKSLFVTCLRQVRSASDHPALRDLTVRALTESWGDPADLADFVQSLIKAGPETGPAIARAAASWPQRLTAPQLFGGVDADRIFDDRLLSAWLELARVTDLEIERFLTLARSVLLQRANDAASDAATAQELRFWASLAQQCFTNDFVFASTADEDAAAAQLRDTIAAALDGMKPVSDLQLLAAAAFARLETLGRAERLLDSTWSDAERAVLTRQLVEPQQERELAASLPRLTPVNDETSRQVQAQYEHNPYPRWIKAAPPPVAMSAQARQYSFFDTMRHPYGESDGAGIEALIAGCGTGRHVVDIAQRYPKARILAVDLSLASLGYAARKTRELGLTNVEFAQADILELGSLGRTFDVIEASGVLHHMRDPFAGWRVLLSLLKPQAYMQVGLYSELARQQVVAARRFIAERGYGSGADDIRRARQDLIAAATDPLLKEVIGLGDFYTVSDCRDLLFHVQENRLTLPQIGAFLPEAGLRFLGFDLDLQARSRYAAQFPNDQAMTNLEQWHLFETQNPRTFIGMYQFWVQRGP